MMYNIGAVCIACILMITSLQSSQSDQKRSHALCTAITPLRKKSYKADEFMQEAECIQSVVDGMPLALARLIVGYAYRNIKFSHEKIIFNERHQQLTSSIFLSPHYLATGASGDCRVKIWDYQKAICTKILCGHGDVVTALAPLPRSSLLASGARNGAVKIWDFTTGICERTFKEHRTSIVALAELPLESFPSGLLVSASDDSIKIWNVGIGCCLTTLNRSECDQIGLDKVNPAVSLASLHENNFYEVSSKNIFHMIYGNHVGDGVSRIRYHTETHDIRSAMLADGNIFITTTEPCLKILSPDNSEKLVACIKLEHQPMSLSYDNGVAFILNSHGSVTVVDITRKKIVQELYAHNYEGERDYSISNVIPLHDGSIIVSCVHGCMHLFNEQN